jgi:hypothetical protein
VLGAGCWLNQISSCASAQAQQQAASSKVKKSRGWQRQGKENQGRKPRGRETKLMKVTYIFRSPCKNKNHQLYKKKALTHSLYILIFVFIDLFFIAFSGCFVTSNKGQGEFKNMIKLFKNNPQSTWAHHKKCGGFPPRPPPPPPSVVLLDLFYRFFGHFVPALAPVDSTKGS